MTYCSQFFIGIWGCFLRYYSLFVILNIKMFSFHWICLTSSLYSSFSTCAPALSTKADRKSIFCHLFIQWKKPLELLCGDSYISHGQAQINVNLDVHPSQKYPRTHCSLIILQFLHFTCPTNQKHKSLIEPCFLPILNPSVKLLENQLNSVALFIWSNRPWQ